MGGKESPNPAAWGGGKSFLGECPQSGGGDLSGGLGQRWGGPRTPGETGKEEGKRRLWGPYPPASRGRLCFLPDAPTRFRPISAWAPPPNP